MTVLARSLVVLAALGALAFAGCGSSSRSGVHGTELSDKAYQARGAPIIRRDIARIAALKAGVVADPSTAFGKFAALLRSFERDLESIGTPPRAHRAAVDGFETKAKDAAGLFDRAQSALRSGDKTKAVALAKRGEAALQAGLALLQAG
ncbi:MAG: hypothetical protein JWM71_1186 [Solirubrobacteraceae bacterium]|nr:hypothetical protein [Solirubrobacteraceae bacterium]